MIAPAVEEGIAAPLPELLATLSLDGRDFERLAKWFLEHDPVFAGRFAAVWLWRDWPGRWGPDRGIDLVAQERDGGLVAVQAKNYSERHSVTKRDLDSFLTESNNVAFSGRLLIATTDRVAASAIEVMKRQEKPVETCLLAQLDESPVAWPTDVSVLTALPIANLEPRPHQREALDAIARWAAGSSTRGQVLMACGTGKTLVAAWTADRLAADRVLVLVPTIDLLRQTATRWAQASKSPRRTLRVCSDRSVGGEASGGSELSSGGTTDPERIAAALAGNGRILVLCTYDSSPVVASAIAQISDSASI